MYIRCMGHGMMKRVRCHTQMEKNLSSPMIYGDKFYSDSGYAKTGYSKAK